MPPSTHCNTAVLGLGGIGSATFCELASRGVDVLGIDRFAPPHALGSSSGQSRIFRVAYFEHADYVPLAIRAREKWVALEAASTKKIFIPTGGAWFGPPDAPQIANAVAAARLHGLPFELLESREATARWKAFTPRDEECCLYEKDAGVICPEHAIESFLTLGQEHGGRLAVNSEICALHIEDNGVRIELANQTINAERVVVALGAWTPVFLADLLAETGVALQVERQVLGWTRPREPTLVAEGAMPSWFFVDDDSTIQYGFPVIDGLPGSAGAKTARHGPGQACDVEDVVRMTDENDKQHLLACLTERVPAAGGELIDSSVCLYTLSADGHFVLGNPGGFDRVTIACGFSGHAFKFAPVLGEALADLALEGASALPVQFLDCARFADSR